MAVLRLEKGNRINDLIEILAFSDNYLIEFTYTSDNIASNSDGETVHIINGSEYGSLEINDGVLYLRILGNGIISLSFSEIRSETVYLDINTNEDVQDYISKIYKGNSLVTKIFKNTRQVLKVYKQEHIVYEWLGEKPEPPIIVEPYTFIEWIEGAGGYFDTNYIPTNNTTLEVKFDRKKDDCILLGGRQTTGTVSRLNPCLLSTMGNGYDIRFDYGNKQTKRVCNFTSQPNILKMTPTQDVWNGTVLGTRTKYTGTFTNSIVLFGTKQNGTYSNINNKFNKIYYTKIWDGDVLKHNYVPAIRNLDNKVGIYDEVTDEFILPIVDKFNIPQQQNIYAKFDGNSYFKTGFDIDTQVFSIIADIYIKDLPSTLEVPFGVIDLSSSKSTYFRPEFYDNTLSVKLVDKTYTTTLNDNTEYEITLQISGETNTRSVRYEIMEGDTLKSYVTSASTTLADSYLTQPSSFNPIAIGTSKVMNMVFGYQNYFNQYIKTVRVYTSLSTLAADYEFVEKDGVVQMHDKVTDTYILNSGTGAVTLEDINQYKT